MSDMSRRSATGAKADRDRILEQALTHQLRGDTAATPDCVDAETFAAWQDEALDAAQMAAVELHVSSCPRCQAMLAAFARGSASPLPAMTSDVEGFRWWRWWLAPIAAGATAAVLWMVVPEEQQTATAPPQPPAAAVAVDKVQPPAAFAERKDAEPQPSAAPPAVSRDRAAEADTSAKRNANALEDRQQRTDQPPAAAKEEAPVALAQPAAPAPAAPAPAPPTAARAEAAGARMSELQKSAQLAFAPVEVPTLDRNIRWRFAGRRIERTADGGTTWTPMHDANDTISAGSAPTTSVAWFVGRNGFVILTADAGATFTSASLAEALDIASVSATDARQAVISTVSGRRFRTEDGGHTWLPF